MKSRNPVVVHCRIGYRSLMLPIQASDALTLAARAAGQRRTAALVGGGMSGERPGQVSALGRQRGTEVIGYPLPDRGPPHPC